MDRTIVGNVAEAMLDYVENDKTFMTDRSMTVPTRSYVDADQWGAEMELIFKRVPLMLALTCEMPKPGDYKAMEAVGLPILISRDKWGVARAFLNVCSHRGAPVAKDGHGNCARFTCVYHGWTFAADGKRLLPLADLLSGLNITARFPNSDSTPILYRLWGDCGQQFIGICSCEVAAWDLDGVCRAERDQHDGKGSREHANRALL